jgi:pSer/pThr/pTyr-binding forkhead associated (FHA) protein
VVINDELLASTHLGILWDKDAGQFMIADFGSENGTFISGRRIPREWTVLLPNQVVLFGRNNRMFVHENPSPTLDLKEPLKMEPRKIARRKK